MGARLFLLPFEMQRNFVLKDNFTSLYGSLCTNISKLKREISNNICFRSFNLKSSYTDDWRNVVNLNENISFLYIAYQMLLFCSSILTPATIFLLIVGAMNTAFPGLDLIQSLVINAIPVGLFLVTCFYCSSQWQVGTVTYIPLCFCVRKM